MPSYSFTLDLTELTTLYLPQLNFPGSAPEICIKFWICVVAMLGFKVILYVASLFYISGIHILIKIDEMV